MKTIVNDKLAPTIDKLTEDDMREALILLLKAEHDLHHDNDGIFKHRRALRSLECVGEAIRLLQEELEERL
jgi:hypothetical protein